MYVRSNIFTIFTTISDKFHDAYGVSIRHQKKNQFWVMNVFFLLSNEP